ncbi:hypothetical protein DFA_06977 [Cavenderia fasciculata]|uniref:Ankyrin repeat-containing protein n=1 Tax=Cavenderia fasciculata TaxID=261658 RepID=F4PX71_CACFS|nr:uncharacterized protein DFA_06977 [Cavenderia fasciculata]EGG19874.1 hypothetical protein DFA_06977 [Cavenderia fasciculata]|eukprot:XP_004366857.1 hypothetical protein DFA_06977 [Cavenderia fasciculata]
MNSNNNNNNSIDIKDQRLIELVIKNKWLFKLILSKCKRSRKITDSMTQYDCEGTRKKFTGNSSPILQFELGIRENYWDYYALEMIVYHGHWGLIKDRIKSKRQLFIDNRGLSVFIKKCTDNSIFDLLYQHYQSVFAYEDLLLWAVEGGNRGGKEEGKEESIHIFKTLFEQTVPTQLPRTGVLEAAIGHGRIDILQLLATTTTSTIQHDEYILDCAINHDSHLVYDEYCRLFGAGGAGVGGSVKVTGRCMVNGDIDFIRNIPIAPNLQDQILQSYFLIYRHKSTYDRQLHVLTKMQGYASCLGSFDLSAITQTVTEAAALKGLILSTEQIKMHSIQNIIVMSGGTPIQLIERSLLKESIESGLNSFIYFLTFKQLLSLNSTIGKLINISKKEKRINILIFIFIFILLVLEKKGELLGMICRYGELEHLEYLKSSRLDLHEFTNLKWMIEYVDWRVLVEREKIGMMHFILTVSPQMADNITYKSTRMSDSVVKYLDSRNDSKHFYKIFDCHLTDYALYQLLMLSPYINPTTQFSSKEEEFHFEKYPIMSKRNTFLLFDPIRIIMLFCQIGDTNLLDTYYQTLVKIKKMITDWTTIRSQYKLGTVRRGVGPTLLNVLYSDTHQQQTIPYLSAQDVFFRKYAEFYLNNYYIESFLDHVVKSGSVRLIKHVINRDEIYHYNEDDNTTSIVKLQFKTELGYKLAGETGNVDLYKCVKNNHSDPKLHQLPLVWGLATKHGRFDLFKYLCTNYEVYGQTSFHIQNNIILYNHLNLLDYYIEFRETKQAFIWSLANVSIFNGCNLSTLQYLCKKYHTCVIRQNVKVKEEEEEEETKNEQQKEEDTNDSDDDGDSTTCWNWEFNNNNLNDQVPEYLPLYNTTNREVAQSIMDSLVSSALLKTVPQKLDKNVTPELRYYLKSLNLFQGGSSNNNDQNSKPQVSPKSFISNFFGFWNGSNKM